MKIFFTIILLISCINYSNAQRWDRIISGASKAYQAYTISDAEMADYAKEYITQLDARNIVCKKSNKYAVRLNKLTQNFKSANGITLNFKVYHISDINAFACPDGSIRVYSGLMDIMTDNEILGIIGHEIGHIANSDSKDAFKNALITSAIMDGAAAFSYKATLFSDSSLGALSAAYLEANYSRKQEFAADEYGYNFLKRIGINPKAMVLALKKLNNLKNSSESSISDVLMQLFSTHPALEERIKIMEQKARQDGYL